LCLAISPDDTHIVGGLSDGTLSVRRREIKGSDDLQNQLDSLTLLSVHFNPGSKSHDLGELRLHTQTSKRLKEHDKMLKNFRYSAALDSVLKKNVPPTTAFAVVQELIHRDGLRIALFGRDDVLLEPILRLLIRYVSDHRFGELVANVTSIVLEMYASVIGQAPVINVLFLRLQKKLAAELHFQEEIMKTKGALTMILASTSTSTGLRS